MKKKILALALVSVLTTLTGCNEKKDVASENKPAASKQVQDAAKTEYEATEKTNQYIMLNNDLMTFWSDPNATTFELEAREKHDREIAKGNSIFIRSASSVERAQKQLAKTLELKTDLGELDKAAKELKETIDAILPNWKEIEDYNSAQKYEDDGGKKGKELLPAYADGLKKLKVAYDKFDQLVAEAVVVEKNKRMAEYKAKGLMLELHTEEAMGNARQMLELFNDVKDFKNKEKIEKANALLAELDAHLDEIKKMNEKASAEGKPTGSSEAIHRKLVSFTANYREARKNPQSYNAMVKEYNYAIEEFNRR